MCDYSTGMFLGSRNPFLWLFFTFDKNYVSWGSKNPSWGQNGQNIGIVKITSQSLLLDYEK